MISVLGKGYAKVFNERVNRQISGKIMELPRSHLYISTCIFALAALCMLSLYPTEVGPWCV